MPRPAFMLLAGVLFSAAAPALAGLASPCTPLATSLTFSDPAPDSAGFALGKLVARAGSLYWFDYDGTLGFTGGALRRVATSGGPVTNLATDLGGVNDFAVDETHLYWTEFDIASGSGSVNRVPIGGGSVEVLAEGTPAGSIYDVFDPLGIALEGDFVYWGEFVGAGAIRQVPKSGGTVVDIGRGQGFDPVSIALDPQFVYIAEFTGRVLRLPRAGGDFDPLATGLVNPFALVLNAGQLFWVALDDQGAVLTMARTGGAVTTLDAPLFNPHSVAVSGGYAYYSPGSAGGGPSPPPLKRVPRSGGTPVAAADCSPTSLIPLWVQLEQGEAYGLVTNGGPGNGMVVDLPEPTAAWLRLVALGGVCGLVPCRRGRRQG